MTLQCLLFGFCGMQAQTVWHDPMAEPVPALDGRGWDTEIGRSFQRLPERMKSEVRADVWALSQSTAGIYVNFTTDAQEITIRYTVSDARNLPNVGAMAKSGVDLYVTDQHGKKEWCACPANFSIFGDTIAYRYRNLSYEEHPRGKEYRLYLPLYNHVTSLVIGTPATARFAFVAPSPERPVVIYGTSIAQGASASRPGLAWTNRVQNALDRPVYNLGFSGNGKLEDALFDALAEQDAALYVIDCMPNMYETDSIAPRLLRGIARLRRRRSAPVLLVEHCGYHYTNVSPKERTQWHRSNEILRQTYDRLTAAGTPNLHYLTEAEIGLATLDDAQVDGIHPTDAGMARYAVAMTRKAREILGETETFFAPVRQRRDIVFYDWEARHRAVLARHQTVRPDVLLIGNSITHYWGGEPLAPKAAAPEAWKRTFRGRTATNMGFGWDRIENVFWRIYHGELDGIAPRDIFLLIGTNNIGYNAPKDIAAGIHRLSLLLHDRQPQARLHVVKLLPRTDAPAEVAAVNEALDRALTPAPWLNVVDVTARFTHPDGTIDESLFSDGLHPNKRGYELLGETYRKVLQTGTKQ